LLSASDFFAPSRLRAFAVNNPGQDASFTRRQTLMRAKSRAVLYIAAMPTRIIVRLELSTEAARILPRIIQYHGMKNIELMSRLLEWLDDQPSTIRNGILRGDATIGHEILCRLADSR
jgi:hypothetical protein